MPPIADDLPGFGGSPVNDVSVRSGTPKDIVALLNRDLNAVIESRELKASLLGMGVGPKGGTPEEMAALVQKEIAKWRDVIRLSGARVE